jgi:hypothetical protein
MTAMLASNDVQMKPAIGRRIRRMCAALGLLVSLASLTGCFSQDDRKQMADADSILAPIFKTTTPADAAMWASDTVDVDKRARGMNLLANAPFGGAEAYLKLYRERLNDDSPPVQAIACRALGMHGSPEDVPRLIPLTKVTSDLVRIEATRALQRLHNPAAIPALLDRLKIDKTSIVGGQATSVLAEPEPEIRAEAASALGQYADDRVLQGLFQALADPSLLVNKNAHDSLRTLTGQDELPDDRKAWVNWYNTSKQHFANRRPYVYPVFWREKRWLDYVPFMPAVPNETASTPVGFSLEQAGAPSAAKP